MRLLGFRPGDAEITLSAGIREKESTLFQSGIEKEDRTSQTSRTQDLIQKNSDKTKKKAH